MCPPPPPTSHSSLIALPALGPCRTNFSQVAPLHLCSWRPARNILYPPALSPFVTHLKPTPCCLAQASPLLRPLLWPPLGLGTQAQHWSLGSPLLKTHCTCSDLYPAGSGTLHLVRIPYSSGHKCLSGSHVLSRMSTAQQLRLQMERVLHRFIAYWSWEGSAISIPSFYRRGNRGPVRGVMPRSCHELVGELRLTSRSLDSCFSAPSTSPFRLRAQAIAILPVNVQQFF